MSETTATATKPQISLLERSGTGLAISGAVALGIPLLVMLFDALTKGFRLESLNQVSQVATVGLVLTIGATVLGLLAIATGMSSFLRERTTGHNVSAVLAILSFVGGLALLLTVVLPHATDLQELNTVATFGTTLRDHCKIPLNKTTADLAKARDASQANLTNDAGFSAAMSQTAMLLTQDASTLQAQDLFLAGVKAPEKQYQALLDQCKGTVAAEEDFLTNPKGSSAIPLPPPYNALAASVSAIQLAQETALITAGNGPIKVPPGTLQPLALQAFTKAAASSNPTLTQLSDQLTSDIKTRLTNDLAPIQVDVDTIVQ